MKLWIRNQERDALEEYTQLSVVPIITPNKKQTTWGVVANFGRVGEYATRERCLEIIDEIQNIMCRSGMILFKNIDTTNLSPKDIEPFKAINWSSSPMVDEKSEVTIHNAEIVVYEMPEK